jgi:hypothetical protein
MFQVALLVEALCYKPEGRRFYYRWYHWNFSENSIRNISWGMKAAGAWG